MRTRNLARIAAMLFCAATSLSITAHAQTVICYNCPPEWADWGTELKAIKENLGITVPQDNKNSGQALAQLVAEKASPVADVTYLGVTFGIQAKEDGVVAPYKPAHWTTSRRVSRIPMATGSPSTPGRWASWSTSTRCAASPSRNRGRTC